MKVPKRLLRQGGFLRRKIQRGCFCPIHADSTTQILGGINQEKRATIAAAIFCRACPLPGAFATLPFMPISWNEMARGVHLATSRQRPGGIPRQDHEVENFGTSW